VFTTTFISFSISGSADPEFACEGNIQKNLLSKNQKFGMKYIF